MARFLAVEAAGGVLLVLATVVALVWANSPMRDSYHALWDTRVVLEVEDVVSLDEHGDHGETPSVETAGAAGSDAHHAGADDTGALARTDTDGDHAADDHSTDADTGHASDRGLPLGLAVNDILMAVFFFVVGLEIKRELTTGELRDPRAALLPAVAALGGMIVPAAVFTLVNLGGDGSAGWGIPMATDIAFALGVVALLGRRVPAALKVFLLTLAIVDDIGAILVIAVFYTSELSFGWLLVAAVLVGVVVAMRRAQVWYLPLYLLIGAGVWYAMFKSGVHATIAGVVLGLITPARPLIGQPLRELIEPVLAPAPHGPRDAARASFHVRESVSVAERLEEMLHPFAAYVILPLFALANAGIEISGSSLRAASTSPVTIGVVLGLVIGKTAGIGLFSWLAVRSGHCRLPAGATMGQIVGIGAIGGIGFTVSLFVTDLAFTDPALEAAAKMGVLIASALAAVVGAGLLSARASSSDIDEPEKLVEREPAAIT